MRSNRLAVLVLILFLFPSCKREEQKTEYIARVNDSYLSPREFYTMYDSSKHSPSDSVEVINGWIKRELFWQEAVRKGLLEIDSNRQKIQDVEKKMAYHFLLEEEIIKTQTEIIEDDLSYFYKHHPEFYILKDDAYLINAVTFKDEETAIRWRAEWINKKWEYVKKGIENTPGVVIEQSRYIKFYDIPGKDMLNAMQNMSIGEVSLVIKKNDRQHLVFELIEIFKQGTRPPLEHIRDIVMNDLLASRKIIIEKELFEKLTSESKIEIR